MENCRFCFCNIDCREILFTAGIRRFIFAIQSRITGVDPAALCLAFCLVDVFLRVADHLRSGIGNNQTFLPVEKESFDGECYEITVGGLAGGHSGVEIDRGRANANVVLGRVLQILDNEVGVDIIRMAGGAKDNDIPRIAAAEIMIAAESAKKLEELVKAQDAILKNELHASDAGVALELTPKGTAMAEVLDSTSKITAIHTLNNIPNGIQAYSMDIKGLVETSLNMGIHFRFFVHYPFRILLIL